MLVIQHIWHRWDKWTRGADRPDRVLLEPVYPLPVCEGRPDPQQEAFVHDVHADMWEDRPRYEGCGVMKHDAWTSGGSAVDWKLRSGKAEISLTDPSRWRRQSKWPGWLPTPLFVLSPDETARIHWNARFRRSLFGSNRSSYYEQHIVWLALSDAPHERLFLDATPRKDIDYTTHIY